LLGGDALVEAEGWATAHEAELEPHERDFLAACRRARERAERERRQSQQIRVLAVVAGTVAVLAVIALALTLWFATASKQNAAEAKVAELRARLGELSAQSQLAVDTSPQRAALLAIESMRIAQSADTSYPSAA
jgi:predicted metal-binding membrane protein